MAAFLVVVLVALCGAGVEARTLLQLPSVDSQAARSALAGQVIGLTSSFFEAQRAGKQPNDSSLYSHIWSWKQPSFESPCSTFLKSFGALDLGSTPGYFEAGNTVVVTGTTAFTAGQQALALLNFKPVLDATTPAPAYGGPPQCTNPSLASQNNTAVLLRQLRYIGSSLATSIVYSEDNAPLKFIGITGIADNGTFSGRTSSWASPATYQDKCYFADATNPAADVFGQVASGLALVSAALTSAAVPSDAPLAATLLRKAVHAYEYAVTVAGADPNSPLSSCTQSSAANNCIGNCTANVRTPCILYANPKAPRQQLFVAAASLWRATGDIKYLDAANVYYANGLDVNLLYYNWNNVWQTGIALLADGPYPQPYYQEQLRVAVDLWSTCSVDGMAADCQRSVDGNAFLINIPWGELGGSTNAMCLAGLYLKSGFDLPASPVAARARCFMQRQLGFLTNHKCTGRNSTYACMTPSTEGFSYILGLGKHYPTQIHSRDTTWLDEPDGGFQSRWKTTKDDFHTLCGGLVTGPWQLGSPTDAYTNKRTSYESTEAAIDYAASVPCAFAAWASQPNGAFSGCMGFRTAFDGRTAVA